MAPQASSPSSSPAEQPTPASFAEVAAALAEYTPVALLVFSDAVVHANPAAERLTGYPVDELVGRALTELFPEAVPGSAVAGEEGTGSNELRLVRQDGSQVWVELRMAEITTAEGPLWVASAYDIREHKEAQQAVRMLEKGLETTQIGVTVTDIAGNVLYTNPAEAAMHGYQVEELIGQNVRILAPEELWRPMTLEELRVMSSRRRESVNVRKDGSRFPVLLLSDLVSGEGGEPVAVVTTCIDISERQAAERARRILEKALETTQIGVTISDLEGTILYTNPAEAEMHGHQVEELVGRNVRLFAPQELWHPMSMDELRRMTSRQRESLNMRRDGSTFPVRLLSDVVTDRDGTPIAVVTTCEDITSRRRAEAALRASEQRYALAARGANDGLWDWDLERNLVYYSPRWKSMLGFSGREIGDAPGEWLDRVHPDDVIRLRLDIDSHIDGRLPHFESEYRIRHADGGYRWMLCRGLAVRAADGTTARMAGSQTDITKRKLAEEQLVHGALHDALTGLPNRALFIDRLSHAISLAQRHHGPRFGVLLLGLDRFQLIIDSFGHSLGDHLLMAVAGRLGRCLREGDTLARLGGDGFAILLEDIGGRADCLELAATIQEDLARPFEIEEHEVFTAGSIGITLSSTGYTRAEDVLRDADTALHRAKALGRSRHAVFDAEMHRRAVTLLRLETDLRRALERDEFELHYQPVISLASGSIAGFEALVRWRHPTRGLVDPDDFIAVTEETGLIVPLGHWVLYEACCQLRDWHHRHPSHDRLRLSVNLSGRQLERPELRSEVVSLLEETGLDPRLLQLEITESVLMDEHSRALRTISELRELRVELCVDDFGTGYSSLSSLHRFPIDVLKIDGSFVQRMGASRSDSELVRTIVDLAHNMGLAAVAEGVEGAEQLASLRQLGCDFAQGFLFSRPVPVEAAESLLSVGPRW